MDHRDLKLEQEEKEKALLQQKEEIEKQKEEERRKREEEEKRAAGTIEMEVEEESNIHVTRIMTKEERMAAIQNLVASIPADKDGLWSWPVRWEYLDQTILSKKLEPFLKKKVVEYIGDESNDLVAFILEKISSHSDIQSIHDELAPVMKILINS